MPHEGVVTDRYKLVRFYAPQREEYYELFDLAKDPCELTSVYGQPDYADIQKRLTDELARLKIELKVPDPIPPDFYGKRHGIYTPGMKTGE